jgi:hypothetical protein
MIGVYLFMTEEIYISTDIESDGPIPGPNSMLSIGSAAFKTDRTLLGTYSVNLKLLPGASGNTDTMKWWATQPEAWAACRKDPQDPSVAMAKFVEWVESFGGSPVFVGYPATFDFLFVYHYLMSFVGRSPFSFSALDIKSFAMAKLGTSFRHTTKRNMPNGWFQGLPKHTHVAVDDAIEQGLLFLNILHSKSRT